MNWYRNRSVCARLLMLRAEVERAWRLWFKSFDAPLEVWQNKAAGRSWKSKWSLLVELTYQFFEEGNRPLHLVLLVMCICRMETFHSGVESFDPMTCGGQPYKRKRGFTISPWVFTAHWSAIIGCTCCNTCLSCVYVLSFQCVQTTASCNQVQFSSMLRNDAGCPRMPTVCLVTQSHRKVCFTKGENLPRAWDLTSDIIVYVFLRAILVEKSSPESLLVNNVEQPR